MNEETKAPEEKTSSAAEDKEPGKRLTPAQWTEISTLWELGDTTLSALSDRFGITKSALSQYFKRHGFVHGSRRGEIAAAVAAKVTGVSSDFEAKKKARIEETKEKAYNQLKVLNQMGIKIVVEASKSGGGMATAKDHLKALHLAVEINSSTISDMLRVLDADKHIDEEYLPQIVFRDLSNEDLEKLQTVSDEDLDIEDLLDDAPVSSEDEEEELVVEEEDDPT